MKQKILQLFPLVLVVILGFFLRVYNINNLPATLNPDEAALGYSAFSLLKTGADEHGVLFPLALESFGDWKLPVYSYLDTIPLAIFGVSKFAVRLPSILAGTLAVILIYFVAFKIFKNKGIALLSSLFLAINPWSIFFSRGAYEVNVATTIFLGGFLSLLFFFSKKKDYLLVVSFLLFGITMFTQHNYIVFSPLFVLTILTVLRGKYTLNKGFIFSLMFFILIIVSAIFSLSQGGGQKTSNLNIFNDKNVIYNRADRLRGDSSNGIKVFEKLLYNKYSAGMYQLTINYLNAYSPNVLFDKGGERLTHNIGDIGYFYVFDAALFLLGLGFLLFKREKDALLFLLLWLILAPIPSAITTEHTGTRLFTMVPPMIMVISFGFYSLINVLKSRILQNITLLALSFFVLLGFLYFINYYFVHFNTQRIRFWRYGYEDAGVVAQNYKDYKVVMRGPENFPYIYFLLYEQYDPGQFVKEVEYYPTTGEGFRYVKRFGRFEFVNSIDYSNLKRKTIYFDDSRLDDPKNTIFLPSGEPIMGYHIVE